MISQATFLNEIGYVTHKDSSRIELLDGSSINAYSTYPFNPASKASRTSAINWAKQSNVIINPARPIYVRLITIDTRGRGGRAYRVIDDSLRVFDLREDQFLEALKFGTIGSGGIISAPFAWVLTTGSSVKLAVINGNLDKSAQLSNLTKLTYISSNPISKPHSIPEVLVAGNVYEEKRSGKQFIYLGAFNLHSKNVKKSSNKLYHAWAYEPYMFNMRHYMSSTRPLWMNCTDEEYRILSDACTYWSTSWEKMTITDRFDIVENKFKDLIKQIFNNSLTNQTSITIGKNPPHIHHFIERISDKFLVDLRTSNKRVIIDKYDILKAKSSVLVKITTDYDSLLMQEQIYLKQAQTYSEINWVTNLSI